MIDTPGVVHTAHRTTAVIHRTVPSADMPKSFWPAVTELRAELTSQGVAPAGPLVAYHFNLTGIGDGVYLTSSWAFPSTHPCAQMGG